MCAMSLFFYYYNGGELFGSQSCCPYVLAMGGLSSGIVDGGPVYLLVCTFYSVNLMPQGQEGELNVALSMIYRILVDNFLAF